MYYDNPLMLGYVRLLCPIWWQVPHRWVLSPWSSTYSNADKYLLVEPRDPTGLPLVAIGTGSLMEIWFSINLSISFWRILCSEGDKFACLSCKRAMLSWKLDITGRCGGCARARCQCASKSFLPAIHCQHHDRFHFVRARHTMNLAKCTRALNLMFQ